MIFGCFELISIAVWCVMRVSDSFRLVISNYERRQRDEDLTFILAMMAFFGGWFLAPYFIYLVFKYIKVTHKK